MRIQAIPHFNEAQPYRLIGSFSDVSGNSYTVQVAYADNVHTNVCGSGSGGGLPGGLTGNPTCLPNIFNGAGGTTAATFFFGTSAFNPFPQNNPFHCPTGAAMGCWDGGVILITNTSSVIPEPSSLVLVGSGLLGVAGWGRRRKGTRKIS